MKRYIVHRCSLQHKDTKNESKSQPGRDVFQRISSCSLQHKDTKNESKSQLVRVQAQIVVQLFFTTQRY